MTDSSTGGDADLGSAVENALDANPAASSDAEVNAGAGTLQDAVNTALGDGQEETPASDEQDPEGSDSESNEGDDLSEEEKKHFSERAQRRFRELVEQRKTVEGKVAEVQQELEAVKPKAERMDQLTGYMRQHDIAPEHLNNALGLTAMINSGDYQSALPILEGLLQQVRNAAGEVLPNDLQQQVNLGYITEAHAKELHKARLGQKRAESQAQNERERVEAERRQTETQNLVRTVASTADSWSKEQAQSDPDWNLKRDRVTEKVELELRRLGAEGYPRTDKAVRELLGKVKQEVETELKRFRPAVQPIQPSPTGNGVSPRSKAKPASLMDAVNGALSE